MVYRPELVSKSIYLKLVFKLYSDSLQANHTDLSLNLYTSAVLRWDLSCSIIFFNFYFLTSFFLEHFGTTKKFFWKASLAWRMYSHLLHARTSGSLGAQWRSDFRQRALLACWQIITETPVLHSLYYKWKLSWFMLLEVLSKKYFNSTIEINSINLNIS